MYSDARQTRGITRPFLRAKSREIDTFDVQRTGVAAQHAPLAVFKWAHRGQPVADKKSREKPKRPAGRPGAEVHETS
ncbi:MAG TPA: hypothetical protein VGX49_14230 [Jatrophihabitans sp.]|jgi:hypothetical protein|nr:hypothetical protein [Jatrophihabitans sp.]